MALEIVETPINRSRNYCLGCRNVRLTVDGYCLECRHKNTSYAEPVFNYLHNEQEFAIAAEAYDLGKDLIHEHFHYLEENDVRVDYVFVKKPSMIPHSDVEMTAKVKKVSGINAWLTLPIDYRAEKTMPEEFFLIEICHRHWQYLSLTHRICELDKQLCCCGVNEKGRLQINPSSWTAYTDNVRRRGFWESAAREVIEAAKEREKQPLLTNVEFSASK